MLGLALFVLPFPPTGIEKLQPKNRSITTVTNNSIPGDHVMEAITN